jgi:type I restriction enzyme M protein
MNRISETETVIKKIVPYLQRKGYDIDKDMKFEEPTEFEDERKGFIDILITCGKKIPYFVIEAKRDGTKFTNKHRKQAISYGRNFKTLFVALTNGKHFELINTTTSGKLYYNGSPFNRLPNKNDLLRYFIPQLKKDLKTEEVLISSDNSLPFRPGLPLSKLNHLFKQCHNSIRKIEKNEESAFSDFSKILFLKLLEEKWELEGIDPPYTYMFHELALYRKERADQVQTAIKSMINAIKDKTNYGDVLDDPIRLKKDSTYLTIVKQLSNVSFIDCDLDTKGAAFEYFVRATLKGKKLGQYFTPRPLVKLMLHLGRFKQIVNNLMANLPFNVLDPACGTGGFLVFG